MTVYARLIAVAGVLLLFLVSLPEAASAQEAGIVGVIVRLDAAQETFWVQDLSATAAGRIWTVRVTSVTEGRRPEDQIARGTQPTLRLLRVGDVVEVQGWVTGANQLLAREILVRAGGGVVADPRVTPRGQEIEVEGIIVALDLFRQGILQLQERSRARTFRVWTVRLLQQTRVEGRREGRTWEEHRGWGLQAAQRLLSVGDLIEVEGRLIATGQILAEEIKVRSHAGIVSGPTPFPQPVPFPTPPFSWQTVILSPQPGTQISGGEFTVVGQTMPGAQVRIEVMGRWSLFQVLVANSTVTADQSGIFVLVVRPSMRVPGATYTITATSTFQGVSMIPVSVTVRQI